MEECNKHVVENVINKMDPISLEEMDYVKLMRRRDTKFVIPAEKVAGIIDSVKNHYRVLEIDEKRIHGYQTLYYDTPEFEMYRSHHNGRLNRYKIRVRKYLTSDISFLEVKYKNNRRETIKRRIRPETPEVITGTDSVEFLSKNSPYSPAEIQPSLMNTFCRITIVHKSIAERITIDLGLEFKDINGKEDMEIPNLAIIEVKRDRDSSPSNMTELLKENNIRASGFSKYCMGTALTNPAVKKNLFIKNMRYISRFEPVFEKYK